jgi:hypothetical protein
MQDARLCLCPVSAAALLCMELASLSRLAWLACKQNKNLRPESKTFLLHFMQRICCAMLAQANAKDNGSSVIVVVSPSAATVVIVVISATSSIAVAVIAAIACCAIIVVIGIIVGHVRQGAPLLLAGHLVGQRGPQATLGTHSNVGSGCGPRSCTILGGVIIFLFFFFLLFFLFIIVVVFVLVFLVHIRQFRRIRFLFRFQLGQQSLQRTVVDLVGVFLFGQQAHRGFGGSGGGARFHLFDRTGQ